jgi:hypothetical protein
MEYYQKRAVCERELARTSANASVARVHAEMAEHYEKILAAAQAGTRSLSNQLAER